jgi:hypothetical protein
MTQAVRHGVQAVGTHGGLARGDWPLRIYVTDKDYQATEIDTGDAARMFLTWLADEGSPVLGRAIGNWLWQPQEAGGLGALADSDTDVAALCAEVVPLLRAVRQPGVPDGRDTP